MCIASNGGMTLIDISDEAIVSERRASNGRFVLFCDTDLPENFLIPWWSVMADIGGDGAAVLVRLDERQGGEGFTAVGLIRIALTITEAGVAQRSPILAGEILRHLRKALEAELRRRGALPEGEPLRIEAAPTPGFPRLHAECGDGGLALSADPSGREEGVTLEQVLIMLDQLYLDASRRLPDDGRLAEAGVHVDQALRLESRRASLSTGGR